jgi:hypothetical protein
MRGAEIVRRRLHFSDTHLADGAQGGDEFAAIGERQDRVAVVDELHQDRAGAGHGGFQLGGVSGQQGVEESGNHPRVESGVAPLAAEQFSLSRANDLVTRIQYSPY